MKITQFLLLLLFWLIMPLYAGVEGVGTTAANFLKLGSSARSAAMGEAYVALSDDAGGMAYNPAGMISMHRSSLQFTHTSWFKGAYIESFHLVSAVRPSLFVGGVFSFIGLPSQQLTTATGSSSDPLQNFSVLGSFSPFNMQGGLAVASLLNPNWKVGGSLNVTGQSIAGNTAVGLGVDIGLLWTTPLRNLDLGLSVQNLGMAIPIYKERFGLPFNARLGAAYQAHKTTLVSLEADMPSDNAFGFSFGLEGNMDHLVFIRGGWRYDNIFNPFSLGMGFRMNNSMLDLVWVPAGELGHTFRISLALDWGGWASAHKVVELRVHNSLIETRLNSKTASLHGLVGEPEQATGWNLYISPESGGAVVGQFSGKGAPTQMMSWDGKNAQGTMVPDGNYQARLQVSFISGESANSEPQLLFVNPPLPEISMEINPNSTDTRQANAIFVPTEFKIKSAKMAKAYRYRIEIKDAQGKLFQNLDGDLKEEVLLTWQGYDAAGMTLTSNSDYTFKLILLDEDGKPAKEFTTLTRRCVFRW